MEIIRSSIRGFRILALVTLVVCCAAVICSVTALGTMGQVYGVAPGIGDIVTYLLQIHAFTAFFLGWMCLAFLFARRRREFFVRLSAWALLVLMLLHIAPFFTDTVFYMTTVSFSAGLNYFSAYVPALAAAVAMAVFLNSRKERGLRTVNRTALICGLTAIFMCIVYLAQVFPLMALTSTLHDNSQLWGLVFGNSAITLSVVLIWALTLSRRGYERILYDMTDEEALTYEIVRERSEEEAQRIRLEVEEELAQDGRREAAFEERGGADGAVPEDLQPAAEASRSQANPLLARWDLHEEEEENDPLDELWRPEPVEEVEETETEEAEGEEMEEEPEPEVRRSRFIPAHQNRPADRSGK